MASTLCLCSIQLYFSTQYSTKFTRFHQNFRLCVYLDRDVVGSTLISSIEYDWFQNIRGSFQPFLFMSKQQFSNNVFTSFKQFEVFSHRYSRWIKMKTASKWISATSLDIDSKLVTLREYQLKFYPGSKTWENNFVAFNVLDMIE